MFKQKTFYLQIITFLLVAYITVSTTYLTYVKKPVPTREGCILYSGTEYCASRFDATCSRSTVTCVFAYFCQLVANLFWLLISSILLFAFFRVLFWVNESTYRDAQLNYALTMHRAFDEQSITGRRMRMGKLEDIEIV